MNITEIKTLLPHREPMLLVEEAFVDENGEAVGRYAVKGGEWFLQGHYPGNPVVPGVILCEMMAQTCCVLLAGGMDKNCTPFFTGLDRVKFRKPVRAGSVFESRCSLTRVKKPFYFAQGKGLVNGAAVCSANFSFALVPKQ